MAGYESHDGKIAGNRQLVESHDRAQGKRSKHMGAERSGTSRDGAGQGGEEHGEIKSVVAEHGPAHAHHITKGRDGGGFHSETHHESGHVAHADHETLEEAHEHGKEAMGADDEMSGSMLPMDEEEGAGIAEGEQGGSAGGLMRHMGR